MQTLAQIKLTDVQAIYDGAEGDLWELLMGEQIHIGGLASSNDLADRAVIQPGTRGVDLCCCNGAGMRYLLRFREVAHMTGVDATATVLDRARARAAEEGFADRVSFIQSCATACDLPDQGFDFVWGEDAWVYVVDKERLVQEAARLTKPTGTIAFTDWMEGPAGLSAEEAKRFMTFMSFPSLQSLAGYRESLERAGCTVTVAEDTGRFAAHVDLYIRMVSMQLTYDVLKRIGFDQAMLAAMGAEMAFMKELAEAGKIVQGLIVATKN